MARLGQHRSPRTIPTPTQEQKNRVPRNWSRTEFFPPMLRILRQLPRWTVPTARSQWRTPPRWPGSRRLPPDRSGVGDKPNEANQFVAARRSGGADLATGVVHQKLGALVQFGLCPQPRSTRIGKQVREKDLGERRDETVVRPAAVSYRQSA
jgi:hypothetical protein